MELGGHIKEGFKPTRQAEGEGIKHCAQSRMLKLSLGTQIPGGLTACPRAAVVPAGRGSREHASSVIIQTIPYEKRNTTYYRQDLPRVAWYLRSITHLPRLIHHC